LPPGLSGWGACTLAAAASEASGETNNLHHSGANRPNPDFLEGFGGVNRNGEKGVVR